MKPKKCKSCGETFTPDRPFQKCCKYSCAIDYVALIKTKEQKTTNRKEKQEFNQNDKQFLTSLAQKVFNTFIRVRDGRDCISCGYKGNGRQFHAGHYKSQGGNSALRFDELNVHAQCSICNNHLSGNLANYRMKLIEKIGIQSVENLEQSKTTKRWTVEELKEIIETYKKKTKDL